MSKQQKLFEAYDRAKAAADLRFNLGESDEKRLLQHIASSVPRDRYQYPNRMSFNIREQAGGKYGLVLCYPGTDSAPEEVVTIHPHAMRQLAERASIAITYVKFLNQGEEWKASLLATNFNTLFQRGTYLDRSRKPMRFLHRRVGSQLRAFLSSSYNRHLVSVALLGPFLEAARAETARPVEAIVSDIRVSLKCFHDIPFEVVPGKYVCIGAEWANSDFGAGRLTVSQAVWDPLSGTRATLDETFGRVHLGPVVEGDTDVDLPDEVNKQIVEVQGAAIAATVKKMLQPEAIDQVLAGLRIAHEKEISWKQLRGQLGKLLSEKEIGNVEALLRGEYEEGDLPPPATDVIGNPLISHWWAAELLSSFADKAGEGEKKIELQSAAGKMLALKGEAA